MTRHLNGRSYHCNFWTSRSRIWYTEWLFLSYPNSGGPKNVMVTLSIEYGDTKQVINMVSQNVAAHNYRSWVSFTRYHYEAVNHLKLTVQNRYYIHNSALHLAKNGTRFERSSICNFQIFHHLAKCMSQYEDVHSFVHNVQLAWTSN